MMPESLLHQVNRLLETKPPVSRNRDFKIFDHGEGKRLFKLYRLYLSILRELEDAAYTPGMRVSSGRTPEGLELVLSNPGLAYSRHCLIPTEISHHFEKALKRLGVWGEVKS
jgi:hypothetical protein